MAKDVTKLRVAGNGSVYVAPVGTTAPATPTAAWPAGWIELGYTTEDGVTFTDERDMDEIKVWQMFYAARRVVTGKNATLAFVLAQWTLETVRLAFGGGTVTTVTGGYRYSPPAPQTLDERAVGVEFIDGTVTKRIIMPRALLTENVETQFSRTGMAELPITMSAIGSDGIDPWYLLDSTDLAA